MKRPGPITTSIVAMSVFSLLIIAVTIFIGGTFSLIIFIVVPAVVDIVFLIIRKRWMYYYNLVTVAWLILFCVMTAIISAAGAGMALMAGYRTVGFIIYIVPAGLLIWLFVELLKRKDVKEYFAQSRGSENNDGNLGENSGNDSKN